MAKRRDRGIVELRINTRVRPAGPTRDNLTYGYVRGINPRGVEVYWPEIKGSGTWPQDAIIADSGGKRWGN